MGQIEQQSCTRNPQTAEMGGNLGAMDQKRVQSGSQAQRSKHANKKGLKRVWGKCNRITEQLEGASQHHQLEPNFLAAARTLINSEVISSVALACFSLCAPLLWQHIPHTVQREVSFVANSGLIRIFIIV